jgi:hypothetical protein
MKTKFKLTKRYNKPLKSFTITTTPFDNRKPIHDYRNDEWYIKAFGKPNKQ